jgi:endo-1,4-beta-xylanase
MVSPEDIAGDTAMRDLAARTCDALVVAGGVFWKSVAKRPGRYDFQRSERVRDFGVANRMVMRGSTLVWHEQVPFWATVSANHRSAAKMLRSHVHRMVSHFRGSIAYWDVLNEIVNTRDGRPDGLRRSMWLQHCGPEYISASLSVAHEADPATLLGYNEWGLEDDGRPAQEKRKAVLALVENLRARDVPLHYLGIQGHLTGEHSYSHGQLGTFLRQVQSLGVRILVTELDVDDRAFPADVRSRDSHVADTYSRFLEIVLRHSKPDMITVWGLSDRSSYPQMTRPRSDGLPQRPLPFDARLQPKPAWEAMVKMGIARERRAT